MPNSRANLKMKAKNVVVSRAWKELADLLQASTSLCGFFLYMVFYFPVYLSMEIRFSARA